MLASATALLIGLHLFFRVNLGWGLIWNWDELHLMATAARFASDPGLHEGRPPGAYLLLQPLLLAAPSTAWLHWAGRVLAGACALTTLGLVLLLAGRLGGRTAALLCLASLVLEPTWLERSSELRTGSLAAVPALAACLWWACTPRGGGRTWLGTGLLVGASLLLSPKGLYVLVVGGLLLRCRPDGNAQRGGGLIATAACGLAVLLGALLLLPGDGPGLVGWLAGWLEQVRVASYEVWAGTRYIRQGLERAPWLAWLPLAGLLAALARGGASGLVRGATPLLATAGILAIHSARFPYFLAQLTPLWVLAACLPLGDALDAGRGGRRAQLVLSLCAAGSLLVAGPWLLRLLPQTNDHQLETMAIADRLPVDVPYFDPHDMMARHPNPVGNLFSASLAALDAGERGGWPAFRDHLRQSAPAFWIRSRRTDALHRSVRKELEQHYAHLDGNVYLARAGAMGVGAHQLEVPASGSYYVHELEGSARLEGRPLRLGQRLFLTAGAHATELGGSAASLELRWLLEGGWPEAPGPVERVSRRYHE